MTPREPAVLPAPLTPSDCDLQDFKFMPLDVARLRDSDMASEQTPEENWAAVLLWAAAWHQVPAGSMPDSDNWIAKAAGYLSRGRIDPHWQDVRNGAMRGFVLCSDGRWYHPVVCEKANESWIGKLKQRLKTECARIKKHNDRHGTKIPFPEFEAWFEAGCPVGQPLPVPGDTPDMSQGTKPPVPDEKAPPSQGQKSDSSEAGQSNAPGMTGEQHSSSAVSDETDMSQETSANVPRDSTHLSQGTDANVPRENPSKGQGEGQRQGQLTTKTWSSSPQASTEVGEDDDSRTPPLPANRNVQIALLLRAQGIQATSQNPVVCVTWAQNPKVTDEVLNLAIAKAKAAKGDKPIPLGYLFPIVEQELQAQDAPPPDPAQQKPRDSWEWKRTPGGIEAKGRELGMFARGTETHADFAKRIEAEIVKRKGAQP